jgi:hypothetical protein
MLKATVYWIESVHFCTEKGHFWSSSASPYFIFFAQNPPHAPYFQIRAEKARHAER